SICANVLHISLTPPNALCGLWRCVAVHVGFAMSVINEAEARDTLDALQNMFDVEPDVGALLYGEEK
ncbi:hypothetical protein GKF00_15830, partial [Escherichia coli]|nr:hypothetical protein [Escherichia coli]